MTAENTAALDESLAAFPNAKLQDRDEFKDNQFSGIARCSTSSTSCWRCR